MRDNKTPKPTTDIVKLACIAIVFSGLVLIAVIGGLAAPASGPVLAIFPPWTDPSTTEARVTRAGGQIVGYGKRDWIVAVVGASTSLRHDLRLQGAVLLLDPRKAAAICGVSS